MVCAQGDARRRGQRRRDNNQGYAWLRIEGVELFSSQEGQTATREEEFGAPPKSKPLYTEEKAYRFRAPALRRIHQPADRPSSGASPYRYPGSLTVNGWIIGTLGRRERRPALDADQLAGAAPVILIVLRGLEDRGRCRSSRRRWGGLLLTLLLTIVGITASFPLGVALALGGAATCR